MAKQTREHHDWLLEQLSDPVFATEYLNEAHRDSNQMFFKALRNVAEVRKMAAVAKEAGVNRETLYRTLSEDGNPSHVNLRAILEAVGIGIKLVPLQPEHITPGSSSISQETVLIEEISTGVPRQIKTASTLFDSIMLPPQPSSPVMQWSIEVPTSSEYAHAS